MREIETKILPVLEMSCAVCAGNVESTVQALPGVEKAAVNFAANTLTVTYHPAVITLQAMQAAVQAAGYDLIVEAEDPVALADAIEELARNSSLRKIMAAKGRRVAEEQFDQPHSYQTIVDLIRKLI